MIILSLLMPAMIVRQPELVPDALHRPSTLAGRNGVPSIDVLSGGQRELYPIESRLKYLRSDGGRHVQAFGEQLQSGDRGLLGIKRASNEHRSTELKASPTAGLRRIISVEPGAAAGRNCSGFVLCARGVLRHQQSELSNNSLPDAICGRVHLHGPDVGTSRQAPPLVARTLRKAALSVHRRRLGEQLPGNVAA